MPTTTPTQALVRGHLMVSAPALVIIAVIAGVYQLATGGQGRWDLGILIAVAGAWIWWSSMVPRWRDWVIDQGLRPEDVQAGAVRTGLLWPRGSVLERTELRRRDGTRGWQSPPRLDTPSPRGDFPGTPPRSVAPPALLGSRMRFTVLLLAAAAIGCASKPQPVTTAPAAVPVRAPVETVTVTARDPEMERELGRARVQLLERNARIADIDRRLDEATTELVRAMARLRTLATRAEAASAIAEAEVMVQQLRGRAGTQAPPELAQAESELRGASRAFDAENFGGAVYLATQAKRAATAGRGRLAETGGAATRAGERPFALPVPLTTTAAANLREAPSSSSAVVVRLAAGISLTAYSYEQEWLKVATAEGVSAWVHQSVVRSSAGRP